MQIDVVIGAQFGDEGKGLLVDALSSDRTCVVRFNGGAQAGHTVVTPAGDRHVFHHLGAGTFRGARTFLSEPFLVNPIIFATEYAVLANWRPVVWVDPRCRVTTPWDMLLNQAVERQRGASRHGSCGLGIHETVERCLQPEFDLRVSHLGWSYQGVRKLLTQIRKRWVPQRAEVLGVPIPDEARDERLVDLFLDTAQALFLDTKLARPEMLVGTEHLVFEGAQGLRLDEQADGFPHVTRSRTGLPNVMALLPAIGSHEVPCVYYVTRCYVTRHGAGPLPGEVAGHPFGWTGPETNTEGPWQGAFRYALLSASDLGRSITRDLVCASEPVRVGVALTCLDQLPDREVRGPLTDAIEAYCPRVAAVSYGPTRSDVQMVTRSCLERFECDATVDRSRAADRAGAGGAALSGESQ